MRYTETQTTLEEKRGFGLFVNTSRLRGPARLGQRWRGGGPGVQRRSAVQTGPSTLMLRTQFWVSVCAAGAFAPFFYHVEDFGNALRIRRRTSTFSVRTFQGRGTPARGWRARTCDKADHIVCIPLSKRKSLILSAGFIPVFRP